MNPELILQLKTLLKALAALVFALQASQAPVFGSATVSSGDNYPTSTYSFNDNDIINAGDLNSISNYLGIRAATDTISVSGRVNNLSSTVTAINSTGTASLPSSTWYKVANNGSEIPSTSTFRTNLGLSDTAITPSSTFAKVANNLSDVASATARTNLGLSFPIAVNSGGTNATSGALSYGVVTASGSNAFSTIAPGAISNVLTSNGSSWISTTSAAGASVPTGVIWSYASSTAPAGWLLANGQEVATSSFAALFALVGYQYGGSTSTFRVPDLGGRFIAGPSSTLSTTVGATGGSNSVTVGPFSIGATYSNVGFGGGLNGLVNQGSYSTNSQNVTTTPPYMILTYIIKT